MHTARMLAGLAIGCGMVLTGCRQAAPVGTAAVPRVDAARATRNPRASHAAEQGSAPGAFDFYLLNLSWSPEFCATHGASAECGRQLGFVVHGLWPQNIDGTYPEHCSDAPGPADPQAETDLMPTMSLVEHEWQTHGTCSGLAAEAYFGAVRKAFREVKVPAGLGQGDEAMLAPSVILEQFAGANPGFPRESFALSCGNNRLTAVEVCMDRDLRPEACPGVRSCRANVVRVTPR
jgi:ribonuclease T2